eukprot:CAMPEP_0115252028 /NCGR_PEP_ID=MMETSP0270-20121206/43937_1 /TAXON_ID=71861 /ORGANISM="Scrippsiella trochoidea, Strain CCMP3099" /LENGTH=289 /DNA_ID=CAMNT_0002667473 /DNA_START=110 /DNA_END=979 /DNA_ORIENTATION=-
MRTENPFADRFAEGWQQKGKSRNGEENAKTSEKAHQTSARSDDAEKFDKALEINDLRMFVSLLTSQALIEPFDEPMHPWAEDPKTIGALAGTQLAILASTVKAEDSNIKDEIREAGAIGPLIDFLESDQQDRVQSAVVALSFLTTDCSDNAQAVHALGGLPLLMQHVETDLTPMRAAILTTCRNMYAESDELCMNFIKLGGVEVLVRELALSTRDVAKDVADMQLEAILNILDLIEGVDGKPNEKYASKFVEAGAIDHLETVYRLSEDEEVKQSADTALQALGSSRLVE